MRMECLTWRPVITQNGKANVSVAVDVWMDRNLRTDEHDFGSLEGIGGGEAEPEREAFVLVDGSRSADDVHSPLHQGVGAVGEDDAVRGVLFDFHLLSHEALDEPGFAGARSLG